MPSYMIVFIFYTIRGFKISYVKNSMIDVESCSMMPRHKVLSPKRCAASSSEFVQEANLSKSLVFCLLTPTKILLPDNSYKSVSNQKLFQTACCSDLLFMKFFYSCKSHSIADAGDKRIKHEYHWNAIKS